MIRFIADENLNANIVRGLLRRMPEVDIVSVQSVGLSGADDASVLEWAATQGRVLITHDTSTLPRFAYERVVAGDRMPGVFVVAPQVPVGRAVEDLLLLAAYSLDDEWESQVRYLPL